MGDGQWGLVDSVCYPRVSLRYGRAACRPRGEVPLHAPFDAGRVTTNTERIARFREGSMPDSLHPCRWLASRFLERPTSRRSSREIMTHYRPDVRRPGRAAAGRPLFRYDKTPAGRPTWRPLPRPTQRRATLPLLVPTGAPRPSLTAEHSRKKKKKHRCSRRRLVGLTGPGPGLRPCGGMMQRTAAAYQRAGRPLRQQNRGCGVVGVAGGRGYRVRSQAWRGTLSRRRVSVAPGAHY